MNGRKLPPVRAHVFWKLVTSDELLLLLAMLELSGGTGEFIWPSVERLAAYTKLSHRTVQRLIHGYRNPATGVRRRGFLERAVLTQLAPANGAKHRTVTYRLNLEALPDDPEMDSYLDRQPQLPEIRRAPINGEPIPESTPVSACHPGGVSVTPTPTSACHPPGVSVTPDSKAFDSSTHDSKPAIHHGDAALNSLPAWLSFKEQLRNELSDEEWKLWVRPMLLLKTMPAGEDQKHLLAAIPPNTRIQDAALKRLPMMRELLAPAGLNISLTKYPDEWEIQEAQKRYGVDMSPKPWTRQS